MTTAILGFEEGHAVVQWQDPSAGDGGGIPARVTVVGS